MLSSRLMPFADLQEFVRSLELQGQLKRVRVEVDPELEVTEIAQRVIREEGPALLFERPKGSSLPLLMNLFGTMHRVRAARFRKRSEEHTSALQSHHEPVCRLPLEKKK